MTKSSHKKKPTGANLPKAKISRICLNNSMPHCAVIRMPSLKSAKQAVRFANMSYEQKSESIIDAAIRGAGDALKWNSKERFACKALQYGRLKSASLEILALMGHTP